MLQIKSGYDWPTGCIFMFESVNARTDGRRLDWYTISSPCELKIKSKAIFIGLTPWFMPDIAGNPEERFSSNMGVILKSDTFLFYSYVR